MQIAIKSRNSGSVLDRIVGSSLYYIVVQASNILSSQMYREDDTLLYRQGNKILLGNAAWNASLFIFAKFY